MTDKNLRPQRKPEEDSFRNSDSMMPAHQVTETGSLKAVPVKSEPKLKTRKQRRLEQQGVVPPDPLIPENPFRDAELRKKARQFSLMVFNDPDFDPSSMSSLSVSHEEIPSKKNKRKKKPDDFTEDVDMHAMNARIESLLVRFLRIYEK